MPYSASIFNTLNIIITYEDSMAHFGSIYLRAQQIGEHLKAHIDLTIQPLSACQSCSNSLIIIVKPRQYQKLKPLLGKGNILVVDVLDSINTLEQPVTLKQRLFNTSAQAVLKQVDAAIFCSDYSKQHYRHYFKYPELCTTIYHHWDARLKRQPYQPLKQLQVAYFGLVRKAYLHETLSDIDFHGIKNVDDLCSGILQRYNAHYIIKPNEAYYRFEPLTKIAIAAVCYSPVIAIQGHEQELLTEHYPYFVGHLSQEAIIKTLDTMQQTYLDKEWQQALDIMQQVYEKTSIQNAVQCYIQTIKQLTA